MIYINEMPFEKVEGITYISDYEDAVRKIKDKFVDSNGVLWNELNVYRTLVLTDLWFLLYFVMGYKTANDIFVVNRCRDVQTGNDDGILDTWARGHWKSSIKTKARNIQRVLNDPEERVGIFSHTRPAAKSFLREIKTILETNQFLKDLFPDILWQNPQSEALKWSEDDGLILKRKGTYAESTIEAWGLLEGMPTGKHFTYRDYDDIETADLVENPDTIQRLKAKYDISQFLSAKYGKHGVTGTYYHHDGVLVYIRDMKELDGTKTYRERKIPATQDGSPNGVPVYLTQQQLDKLKKNEHDFNCQMLLNPTPLGSARLAGELLKDIDPQFIPSTVYKFMAIDPAGDKKDGKGDAWAVLLVGVEPKIDEIGASNVYILDAMIEPMGQSEAIDQIVRMYIRGGIVQKIGIEKVGLSTVEIHVANALRASGRFITEENGSLEIMRPANRPKAQRIEVLSWPLNNAKLFISTKVHLAYRSRIRAEMDKFPYWHDDALDALSYVYDILKSYTFQKTMKKTKIRYQEAGIV